MTEKHEPQIQTAIRISESLLKRIDKLAERLSKGGFPFTRADVHRRAVELGMAQLEQGEKKLAGKR
jgi:predicted DNA-binding protein